jgi:hypothetical protein
MAGLWRNSSIAQKELAAQFAQKTIEDTQGGQGKAGCPTPQVTRQGRREFLQWLEQRGFEGTLVLEDVLRCPAQIKETVILPGMHIQDFLNDGHFVMPSSVSGKEDIWDLHLADFDPHCWETQRQFLNYTLGGTPTSEYGVAYSVLHGSSDFPEGTLPERTRAGIGKRDEELPHGVFLRYHGCSLYAASNLLATSMVMMSEPHISGHETAAGRGFYTSVDSKAVQFAVPHALGPAKKEWELYGTAKASLGCTTPGSSDDEGVPKASPGCTTSGSNDEPKLTIDDTKEWTTCFHRIVVLVAIPGERGRGGLGRWTKVKEEWCSHPGEGGKEEWTKRPKWLILPAGEEIESVDSPGKKAVPYPGLQERLKPGGLRSRESGETNTLDEHGWVSGGTIIGWPRLWLPPFGADTDAV